MGGNDRNYAGPCGPDHGRTGISLGGGIGIGTLTDALYILRRAWREPKLLTPIVVSRHAAVRATTYPTSTEWSLSSHPSEYRRVKSRRETADKSSAWNSTTQSPQAPATASTSWTRCQ